MYLVVIEKYTGPPQILVFESKADFDRQYQRSWGKIVDEGISRESAQQLYGAIDPKPLEVKMPKDSYNVVFEYDETMGGAYGVRTWTSYADQAEFEKIHTSQGHPGNVVIAQGVTQDEALDLTSLTPEICRLLCAIQQAYEDCSNPDEELLAYHKSMAWYAIQHDRIHIQTHSLARINASKYIKQYSRKDVSRQDLEKHLRLAIQSLSCYNYLGQVR